MSLSESHQSFTSHSSKGFTHTHQNFESESPINSIFAGKKEDNIKCCQPPILGCPILPILMIPPLSWNPSLQSEARFWQMEDKKDKKDKKDWEDKVESEEIAHSLKQFTKRVGNKRVMEAILGEPQKVIICIPRLQSFLLPAELCKWSPFMWDFVTNP